MNRNAYRDEDDGTDQPDTYWRRRVITLGAGLALLGLLAWVFSGGSGKPAQHPAASNSPGTSITPAAAYGRASSSAASAGSGSSGGSTPATGSTTATARGSQTATASPAADASANGLTGLPAARKTSAARGPVRSSATLPGVKTASQPSSGTIEPNGSCAPDSVVLSLFTSKTSYPSGQDPKFSIFAVSTGAQACSFAVGPGKLQVLVMSSGRIIWDSSDCTRGSSTRSVQLKRGVPAQEVVSWNRTVSLPGCVTIASSARAGSYQVQARSGSVSSPVRTFKLAP